MPAENDTGSIFRVTVKKQDNTVWDISAATTIQIKFEKPSGSTAIKTASYTTDGTDGKMEYVSVSGDLDEVGEWQVQGRVVSGSQDLRTTIGKFQVIKDID